MEYELLFLRLGRTTEGLLVVGGLLVELKEALLIFPPDILYMYVGSALPTNALHMYICILYTCPHELLPLRPSYTLVV